MHPSPLARLAPALALLAATTLGAAASAAPIALDVIRVGHEPGFAFSFIHGAAGPCSSEGFCMAGDRLFRLDGTLTGDFDAASGLLSLDPGVVLDAIATQGGADHIAGVSRLDRWALRIDGGKLALGPANPLGDPAAVASDAQGRTVVSGVIAYTLLDDGGAVRDTGRFSFFPRDFSAQNSPNSFDQGVLALWGNNWHNLADPTRSALDPNGIGPLGVDIVARGEVIPEPGSMLLFGLGAGLAGLAIRRRAAGAPS